MLYFSRWYAFIKLIVSFSYLFWSSSGYAWTEVSEEQAAVQSLPAVCLFGARDNEQSEKSICYALDNEAELVALNIPSYRNDKLSSVRLYNQEAIKVYKHTNQQGDDATLFVNVYEMDHLEDAISSFKLFKRPSPTFGCFFEHPGFRGTPKCFSEDNKDLQGFRNRVSSVMLGPETMVEVFSHPDFRGCKKTINQSHAYISDIGWGDDIDSFRLGARKPLVWESAINLICTSGNKARFYQQHRLGSHNSY